MQFITKWKGLCMARFVATLDSALPPEEAFAYGYQGEMRHFVECVRDGATPRETYEDGYAVNCILDAGYESMRRNKWVRVRY